MEQALEGHTRVCGPLSPSGQSRGAHGIGDARRRHSVPGHWATVGAHALAAGKNWAWNDKFGQGSHSRPTWLGDIWPTQSVESVF